MPVLAKFYGIVIRMAFSRASSAHFHAIYGDCELVVGLNPLRVIQSDAPARVHDLVLEWAEAHYFDLLAAWNRCGASLPAAPIAPLR